ncbi:MAG TPA: hypothetical protein VIU86_14625 [Gaiellaceae bacterium]
MTVLAAFAASLAVTVWPQGPAGPARHLQVVCPGNAVCAQLARAGRDAFLPVPPDVACSQVYAGPERALVTGTIAGRRVWARFRRTDSCQTARWQRLGFLFAPGLR